MGGFGHGPASAGEQDSVETSKRNARWGLWLFALYLFFYAGFMILNAFMPDIMDRRPVAGINLAISYGMVLIVSALVLALVYAWVCRNPADAQHIAGSTRGASGETKP